MLPIICSQPACMNIAVKIVIQPCPLMISAGITAHRATNASPSISSRKNTYAFAKTISNVTTANLRGRRDASDKGITVPTFARLLVNWPLALVCAWVASWFYQPAFTASLILAYWLTNVLVFVLMQKGGAKIISEKDAPYSRKLLFRDLAISVLYTLLVVALAKAGVIGPIQDTVQKIQHFVHRS